jgi:hypothetical protein
VPAGKRRKTSNAVAGTLGIEVVFFILSQI